MSQYYKDLTSSGTGVVTKLTGNSGGAVSPTAGNINVIGTGSITVTGNPGTSTLTIAVAGEGFAWSPQSGPFTSNSNNGYVITAAASTTLPGSPSNGDSIAFILNTASALVVTANSGQVIRIGANASSTAGTATSTAIGDSIELVYSSTGTTWFSLGGPQGTWNLA